MASAPNTGGRRRCAGGRAWRSWFRSPIVLLTCRDCGVLATVTPFASAPCGARSRPRAACPAKPGKPRARLADRNTQTLPGPRICSSKLVVSTLARSGHRRASPVSSRGTCTGARPATAQAPLGRLHGGSLAELHATGADRAGGSLWVRAQRQAEIRSRARVSVLGVGPLSQEEHRSDRAPRSCNMGRPGGCRP